MMLPHGMMRNRTVIPTLLGTESCVLLILREQHVNHGDHWAPVKFIHRRSAG